MFWQLLKIFVFVFITCQLCTEVNTDLIDGLKGIFTGLNRNKGNGVANRVRMVINNFFLIKNVYKSKMLIKIFF